MRVTAVLPLSVCAVAQNIVPEYVKTFAPLVHLDINEQYYPGDIGAQLLHTRPTLDFTDITTGPSNLTLSNLSQLNPPGGCTVNNSTCSVYLTSKDPVPVGPPSPNWLYGVLPDPSTGETKNAISSAIVVVDHGSSLVDAFYFYFYPFNLGLNVSGTVFDDHVGDWEHNMVRFQNATPQTVYYSIHSGGEAYTYSSVLKNGSRPLAFSSLGGHASYAVPGHHAVALGVANDTTSYGPLWDPVRSAHFYTFTPSSQSNYTSRNGTFTALLSSNSSSSSSQIPIDWLYYLGRWGDKQYPSTHPGQTVIANITATFTDGPTGPIDKDLYRRDACPDSPAASCVTTSVLPSIIADSQTQTVSRGYTTTTSGTVSGGATAASASSGCVSVRVDSRWGLVGFVVSMWNIDILNNLKGNALLHVV